MSTCAPTRGNGRPLAPVEWNLLAEVFSDDQQQFTPEGMVSEEGLFTWCELRDHPASSTAYWWLVESIDNTLSWAAILCQIDPDSQEVTCPGPYGEILDEMERNRQMIEEDLEERFPGGIPPLEDMINNNLP